MDSCATIIFMPRDLMPQARLDHLDHEIQKLRHGSKRAARCAAEADDKRCATSNHRTSTKLSAACFIPSSDTGDE